MANNIFLRSVAVVLLTLLITSCHHKEKSENMAGELPVAVAYPEVSTVILTDRYPGNLQADTEVDIMARVNGIMQKVYAPSGSKVRKGDLLYSIEDTKYRNAVQQAQASLTTAQSGYEYYKQQYAAMERAFKVEAVSEMELLEARNNMQQSLADIENARAALNTAQTMLGYCTVRAPFDGTLSLQSYDEDALINGEDEPVKINTLYNDNVMNAYISIDEAKFIHIMNNLRSGDIKLDSVEVTFTEALPHRYFSNINYTAPEINPSTGTVTLRFRLDNPWGELKSGMYMNVNVPYELDRDAIIIKNKAISTDQLGKYVYVVNDSNQIVYTPIEIGALYQDTLRIVTKGLTPESRYVTEALLKVKDGMTVKPMAVNSPVKLKEPIPEAEGNN